MSGNCELDTLPESTAQPTAAKFPENSGTNLTSTSTTNTITSNLVPIIGGGIGGLVVILGIFFISRKTRLDQTKPPGSTHGLTLSETNGEDYPPHIIEASFSESSTIPTRSYYTENRSDPPSRVSRSHYSATSDDRDDYSRSHELCQSQITHQSQGTDAHSRSSGGSHRSSNRHSTNYHPDPGGRSRCSSGHAHHGSSKQQDDLRKPNFKDQVRSVPAERQVASPRPRGPDLKDRVSNVPSSRQLHNRRQLLGNGPNFKDQAREVASGLTGGVPVANVVAVLDEESFVDDNQEYEA